MTRRILLTPLSTVVFATLVAGLIAGCDEEEPQPDPPATVTMPSADGMPEFSGRNAFDYIARQVEFGPRNPGSPGAAAALDWLVEELSKSADTVERQPFEHTGYSGREYRMTNVIARFNPGTTPRILLCAHWDTRPRAEEDIDEADRDDPILGANDGGSGVAVLLELARIMKENRPEIGIDIVLFDGEDYGDSDIDGTEQYFLGARHFSRELPADYRYAFGILLDIIGDRDAIFRREGYSQQYAPQVLTRIFAAADFLELDRFVNEQGGSISDDHLPLNRIARIPTIDIIDIEMVGNNSPDPRRRYWHTSDDTMENIGEEPLRQVGELLVYTIYRLLPHDIEQSRKGSA